MDLCRVRILPAVQTASSAPPLLYTALHFSQLLSEMQVYARSLLSSCLSD